VSPLIIAVNDPHHGAKSSTAPLDYGQVIEVFEALDEHLAPNRNALTALLSFANR
jgi:hypothetical protein